MEASKEKMYCYKFTYDEHEDLILVLSTWMADNGNKYDDIQDRIRKILNCMMENR